MYWVFPMQHVAHAPTGDPLICHSPVEHEVSHPVHAQHIVWPEWMPPMPPQSSLGRPKPHPNRSHHPSYPPPLMSTNTLSGTKYDDMHALNPIQGKRESHGGVKQEYKWVSNIRISAQHQWHQMPRTENGDSRPSRPYEPITTQV